MSQPAHELPNDDDIRRHSAHHEDNPDWLVSSDQGAEDERRAAEERSGDEGLRLTTSRDLSTAMPVDRPKVPERGAPGAKRDEERSKGPKTWSAAASSVPRLKVTASASAGVAPMARAPSRTDVAPRGFDDDMKKARALAAASAPDFDDEQEPDDGFPDATGPLAPVAPPARKLEEPIWVVALDALRSNSKIQLLVALVVVLPIVAWIFWPRTEPGVSIHALRKEPARWDGQTVRLNGRVGEVFHVGAGWAYNLHQGRDTIVVFTRGSRPKTREKISVAGSVSTGYLDGQPRQAIFAEPESR